MNRLATALTNVAQTMEMLGFRWALAEEIALARQSIELITARNFHRGRDLMAEFEKLIQP
jgi:hypothetical protein